MDSRDVRNYVRTACVVVLSVVAFTLVEKGRGGAAPMLLLCGAVISGMIGIVFGQKAAGLLLGYSLPLVVMYFLIKGGIWVAIGAAWLHTIPSLYVVWMFENEDLDDRRYRKARPMQVEIVRQEHHKHRRRRKRY